ncbi:MAG: hypothetical protein EOP06_11070 [Proteobacteria bacterium]|nr:MAG: hypothetical protein EOP06_11070 [Pseudomonadota bacterium]
MSLKLVPARLLCVILIATSLVQHEVAFAASNLPAAQRSATKRLSALVKAEDMGTALVAVNEAKLREVDRYFAQGTTQAELNRFHADVEVLIDANAVIRFIAEPNDFKKWFRDNEAAILANRKQLISTDLQELIVENYLAFRAQKAQELSDLPGYVQELKALIDSPATMLAGGFAAAYGTYAFCRDIIKGALIAGPAAGSVGAYLEPIVRPNREYLSVLGNRHLGQAGMKWNEYLNSEKAGLIETREKIEARELARQKTVSLMARMGHQMTGDQAANNMDLFKSNWSDAKQTWEATNPAFYRDGRANVADMLVLRPVALGSNVMISVSGARGFRQGIIYTVDRIKDRSSNPAAVAEAAERLQSDVKEHMHNETLNNANNKTNFEALGRKVEKSFNELMALGAEKAEVVQIVSDHRSELVFYKNAATALAGTALIELMYEEYNRELPTKMAAAYEQFRGNFCFDFFHKEFHVEVNRILTELGLELDNEKKVVNRNLELVEHKISEVAKSEAMIAARKASSAKTAASQPATRVEMRTHRPIIVPNRDAAKVKPEPKTTTKPAVKAATEVKAAAKPSKVVVALKSFISAPQNIAAATGSENLKPGKKKTMADRAREAAARAAKK